MTNVDSNGNHNTIILESQLHIINMSSIYDTVTVDNNCAQGLNKSINYLQYNIDKNFNLLVPAATYYYLYTVPE